MNRISLLFCNVEIISDSRHLSISKSQNSLMYYLHKKLELNFLAKK
jgi:hypothetical protein